MNDERPRLADRGQVYVTLAVAQRYADFLGLRIEEARKQLTLRLLEARLVRDGVPSSWRIRSRTFQLDISATVVPEGPLLVVTAINVREYL